MFRVVVIGQGLIGKQRAQGLTRLATQGRCALAATVDPIPRAPAGFPGVPHFTDLSQVPSSSYDAAIVAVPHHLIKDTCLAVLKSGRPVLVEKPLGMNATEARALVDAARGTPSFVGYNYRFLPPVVETLKRALSGRLGRLRSIDMVLAHGGNPTSAESWKLKPELAGGGVLIDPGVHLLDLLLCIAPGLQFRDIVGTTGFWGTGVEEDIAAVFASGSLLANVRVSHIRWVNTFRIEIGGDDGYAIVEGRGGSYGAQTLRIGKRWGWNDGKGISQKESEETWDFGAGNDSLDVELSAVLDRWTGMSADAHPTGPSSFEHALCVAELCDSMYARLRKTESSFRVG